MSTQGRPKIILQKHRNQQRNYRALIVVESTLESTKDDVCN